MFTAQTQKATMSPKCLCATKMPLRYPRINPPLPAESEDYLLTVCSLLLLVKSYHSLYSPYCFFTVHGKYSMIKVGMRLVKRQVSAFTTPILFL